MFNWKSNERSLHFNNYTMHLVVFELFQVNPMRYNTQFGIHAQPFKLYTWGQTTFSYSSFSATPTTHILSCSASWRVQKASKDKKGILTKRIIFRLVFIDFYWVCAHYMSRKSKRRYNEECRLLRLLTHFNRTQVNWQISMKFWRYSKWQIFEMCHYFY